MEPQATPQLSLAGKVRLVVWMVSVAPVKVAFTVSLSVLNAWMRGLPLWTYFNCGLYRFLLANFTTLELQFLSPGTIGVYKKWIKTAHADAKQKGDQLAAQRLTENIETLQTPSAHILWLGNPATAEKVVLFHHGGGFKVPMIAEHLEWCLQAYVLARPDVEVAVAVLHYSLAPATYPAQLAEASAALAHLLRRGFRPRDIVVGGDSAGGNLTAALLSHLVRPQPSVEAVPLDEPLLGAFLVSPWVSARTDSGSYRSNSGIDMLSAPVCAAAVGEIFQGGDFERDFREGKGWAWPVDVDESWFDGLSRVVQAVYVTVGGQEVFRDHGVQYAERARRRNPGLNVHLEITEAEAHDFILLQVSKKAAGDAMARMRRWFCSLFPE